MKKPVILITNKFADDPVNFGVGRWVRMKENYINSVIRAGGVPIISALGDVKRYADIADGVLFTGGADIDPACYGEENRDAKGVDKVLDEFELALCREFYSRRKPIFGICRGSQLINVALGGTLVQDIVTRVGDGVHKECTDSGVRVHTVTSAEGSILRSLFGEKFKTNTHHHQSVGKCGEGLRITAMTGDGVAEAIEHETLPVFAVQWHPERMIGEENLELENMMPLFEYFVKLCEHG